MLDAKNKTRYTFKKFKHSKGGYILQTSLREILLKRTQTLGEMMKPVFATKNSALFDGFVKILRFVDSQLDSLLRLNFVRTPFEKINTGGSVPVNLKLFVIL